MKALTHKIIIILMAMTVTITLAYAGKQMHKKADPELTTYEQPVIDQLSTAYFNIPLY